jgi:CRISPR-associated protein Cas1
MVKAKTIQLAVDSFGSFLGMEKGCFVLRDKNGNEKRYPLFEDEIGSVQLRSGNTVSVGALASLAFWQIDTLVQTGRGRPIGIFRSLEDDSHVETRIAQYKSQEDEKLPLIAKTLVLSKIEGMNHVLTKYGLRRIDYSHIEKVKWLEESDVRTLRIKLTNVEGHCSKNYFDQIFTMFYEYLRPKGRIGYKAFDKLNNLFNLGYEILSWRVHIALLRARLEPFLGYLHAPAWGKPSLICDFLELYRHVIDDFIIGYARKLEPRDFILKTENFSANRKGKREYLNDLQTRGFAKSLDAYFLTQVNLPRYRMGNRQELETLINEEACLFAKYLRNERKSWTPRIVLP